MKLIFSRKGFDSSHRGGGCPSPIFPDGSMLSVPIPDRNAPLRYEELSWRGRNLGELVERLTRGRVPAHYRAHLDPDLRVDACHRPHGWRAALGQEGTAQGHLRKQRIRPGDVFVFWGVYRPIDEHYRPTGPDVNVVWGWLQVGCVASVDAAVRVGTAAEWGWTRNHPHLALGRFPDASNTLYVASDDLVLPGLVHRLRGSGTFDTFDPKRQLTSPGANASVWRLPEWFHPHGKHSLTFHDDLARWRRDGNAVILHVTSPGQEFVLDCDAFPDAPGWIANLLEGAR